MRCVGLRAERDTGAIQLNFKTDRDSLLPRFRRPSLCLIFPAEKRDDEVDVRSLPRDKRPCQLGENPATGPAYDTFWRRPPTFDLHQHFVGPIASKSVSPPPGLAGCFVSPEWNSLFSSVENGLRLKHTVPPCLTMPTSEEPASRLLKSLRSSPAADLRRFHRLVADLVGCAILLPLFIGLLLVSCLLPAFSALLHLMPAPIGLLVLLLSLGISRSHDHSRAEV